MKFSATFAVLAVFVSKAVVSAAPMPAYKSAIETRAEFVESALEEVWERFYDELLEEVEAREYDSEDIFERAPMKKFAGDLASNLAQNAPGYVKQYSQSKQAEARQGQPRFPGIVQQAQAAAKPAAKPLPASSKWNQVKQPAVMNQIKAASKPSIAEQAGAAFKRPSSSGKKRSFYDSEDDIFKRAPMKKFAGDLASNLAQNAPGYAKQYGQSKQAEARQGQPRFPGVVQQAQAAARPAAKPLSASSKWNTVKQPAVMNQIKAASKPSIADQAGAAFKRPSSSGKKRSLSRGPAEHCSTKNIDPRRKRHVERGLRLRKAVQSD